MTDPTVAALARHADLLEAGLRNALVFGPNWRELDLEALKGNSATDDEP